MKKRNKLKILNDPIYGFITIPNALLFDLIEHRFFQRLRRISQMGLSYLVYPGAHHTRFHHAIGSMHLMQRTIGVLRFKGVEISTNEEQALLIAILLHDIGHGPFSHAMERSIVSGISHEWLSLQCMEEMNRDFNGSLTLAISIFKGEYHRPFFCHLIASQLDMDRLDYLKRDSFYTGVAEGNINSERMISMLHVVEDNLVVEEKGIYSVEKFLLARRLMYWQVYLHKTSLVAEQLLIRTLKRAKEVLQSGQQIEASGPLRYFLVNNVNKENFTTEKLYKFVELDDYDLMAALKAWVHAKDHILRTLASMLLNRNLLKIKIHRKPIPPVKVTQKREEAIRQYNLSEEEASYFIFTGEVSNQAYDLSKNDIRILFKNNKLASIVKATDGEHMIALSQPVTKYFICYPKQKIR